MRVCYRIQRAVAFALLVLLAGGYARAAPERTVTAGALREWPPEYEPGSDGKPNGFAIDVLDAVARRAHVVVHYRLYESFPALMAALTAGEIDVVPNMGITEDRRALYEFTDPIETFGVGLFVRSGSTSLRSLGDLAGRDVAVVRSNVGETMLAGRTDIRIRVYPEVRSAFYDLLAGRVDGIAYPEPVMRSLAHRAGLEDRIQHVGPSLAEVKRAIAVRRGDTALLGALNGGVKELLASSEYAEIYQRWYAPPQPFWTVKRVLWTSGAVVLALLIAFGLWRARSLITLARAEVKFRTVMEHASDGVFIFDTEGRLIEVNERACEMLGYSRAELHRLTLADIVTPEDQRRRPLDPSLRAGDGPLMLERAMLRKDGSVFSAEVSAARVDENTAVGIVRDATERKRAEAALHEQQAMLQHAQKMEAVGRLAGGIAHDFNNLLTAIGGYSELLLQALPAGAAAVADVQQIKEATRRGAALSRQLLTFSRRDVRELAVLDPNTVVGDFENTLRRLLGEEVELAIELGASAHIEADRGQLDQVLMNLVVNARDALPDGGRIAVRTFDLALDAPRPTPTGTLQPGSYVVLEVEDAGVGMSQAVQERIFEPFFTTKPAHEGTGIGLPTVLGIVQQAGGAIDVKSAPGEGSRFRIYLPVTTKRPSSAGPGVSDVAPPPARRNQTVLVVEDEPAVRHVIARALAARGFDVVQAPDGSAALAHVDSGLAFDALVTDVVMPGMNGADLAERVRAVRPDIGVVYMSGYANPHLSAAQLQADRTAFLQKPFSPRALEQALERLVDSVKITRE